MGKEEVEQFLTSLAVDRQVSAATQNQALHALLFLYREVLAQELGWLTDIVPAKRPQRLPTVLTQQEIRTLLGAVQGVPWLISVSIPVRGFSVGIICTSPFRNVP